MRKRKLFTAGCSVSTKNSCSTSYPVELAKLLDYELVDLAAGCGSNNRIFRMITKHIMDGTLTSDDIVTIQYTGPFRAEFWSRFPKDGQEVMEDAYDDGKIIRFKTDAWGWQNHKEESDFFKMYEENHLNEKFNMEIFETNNYNFQHMLDAKNIKAIFIKTGRMNNGVEWYMADSLKKYIFYDYTDLDVVNNQSETDSCHFSDIGHKLIANQLYNHILDLKLNE